MADSQIRPSCTVYATDFYCICCSPFKHEKHSKINKDTKNVTEWMCSLNLGIEIGMKICNICRKELYKEYQRNQADEDSIPSSSRDSSFIDTEASVEYLNKSLELIGELISL